MQIYYDIITLGRPPADAAASIYEIISKYDNRFSYTPGATSIRVNDSFDMNFALNSNNYIVIDNRLTPIRDSATYTVTIVVSTTIFYFLLKTNDAANTPVTGFCWIHDNKDYFGVAESGTSTGQLDSMNFTDKSTSPENRYYTIKRHAQFSIINPNIVFITTSIIADNGGNYAVLSELRSCSNVAFGTTIAINHSNYFAIGVNTLIRIGS